ncbi:MAG: PsiF family protein [Rhodocyclaceae bacterium]
MKKPLATFALVVASQFAFAPAALAVTPQQQRMKDCNAEATQKNLAGQERKDFMKSCLSAKQAEAKTARTAQQEKMKTCNAEASAKKLAGDARKAFMSECLKG